MVMAMALEMVMEMVLEMVMQLEMEMVMQLEMEMEMVEMAARSLQLSMTDSTQMRRLKAGVVVVAVVVAVALWLRQAAALRLPPQL
jgi:hypothetical protein